MKQTMKDILLVSDIDGTICPMFGVVPQRNIDAVKRFQSMGGHFTLATGRHLALVSDLAETFAVSAPLILANGACVYDTKRQECIYNEYLPACAVEIVRRLSSYSKLVAVRVMAEDGVVYNAYQREGEAPDKDAYTKYFVDTLPLEELAHMRWRKALLMSEPEDTEEFRAYIDEQHFEGVDFVASSEFYYEMIPVGVSKANGLRLVAEHLGIELKNTVAIGDYDNDLEMLCTAGLGVAAGNAAENVKAAAELVVCHSENGCLGDLVEYLEEKLAGK